MADFIVLCIDCSDKARPLFDQMSDEEVAEATLFRTSHRVTAGEDEIKKAMVCPRCNGSNCVKTFIGYDVIGYVRGDGYLDKKGAKRDMHLYHLTMNDPYSQYRVPGEVDHLKTQLVQAGKFQTNRKHYDVTPPPSKDES